MPRDAPSSLTTARHVSWNTLSFTMLSVPPARTSKLDHPETMVPFVSPSRAPRAQSTVLLNSTLKRNTSFTPTNFTLTSSLVNIPLERFVFLSSFVSQSLTLILSKQIRGQIGVEYQFYSYLSGTNVVPPVTTSSVGCATFRLSSNNQALDYDIHHSVCFLPPLRHFQSSIHSLSHAR